MEKKVLIITYYWPPSGGSGVQRWLKFVKYLPLEGWQPFVFTPENPSFAIRDESLLADVPLAAEVIHFPIWEPYRLFLRVSGKEARPAELVGDRESTLFQRVSTWIRGNVFIPDPKIFWVRPSVRFLSDFVRENGIRTVVTTGPPHSMHLIGAGLKKNNPGLKWVADFRDPWSQWGLLDSLHTGWVARKLHRWLEARVLKKADRLVTITPFYVRQFSQLAGRPVSLLTNGYDESDFEPFSCERPELFTIRHAGVVNEKCDPRSFLRALKTTAMANPDFRRHTRLEFIGDVHHRVKAFVGEDDVLPSMVLFSPAVPHDQLIQRYARSSVLLLVLHGYRDAEGYLPGKLFEYLATGLPVMAVGPEKGDAAQLLAGSGAGEMIDAANENRMQELLMKHFASWQQRTPPAVASAEARRFSRRAITHELSTLL